MCRYEQQEANTSPCLLPTIKPITTPSPQNSKGNKKTMSIK